MKKQPDLVDCLIKQSQDMDKMKKALEAILLNTLMQKDTVYKTGILANIRMALGEEEYERLVNFYL